MREWIKVLPLGLGLPVMIGVASVKPEDAASNVAAWLHLLGVEHIPPWLSAPGIDSRVVLGSLCLGAIYTFIVWGIPAIRRIRSEPEAIKSPGELYLHNHQDIQNKAVKSYIISWSPGAYFFFRFSDFESAAGNMPPKPPIEKCLTFYLSNVGPGPVRHVKIIWSLPTEDIPNLIKDTVLFGDTNRIIEDHTLLLFSEERASNIPLATIQLVEISKIEDGTTIEITPPTAFNCAWMIFALAKTKQFSAGTPPTTNMLDIMKYGTSPLSPIMIDLEFTNAEGKNKKLCYSIDGFIRPNVGTMAPKPNPGGTWEQEKDAITAWVDHIQIVRRD